MEAGEESFDHALGQEFNATQTGRLARVEQIDAGWGAGGRGH